MTIDPAFEGVYQAWDGVTKTEVVPVKKTIDGVEKDVYEVTQPSHLAWMAEQINNNSLPNDTYMELHQDLDLGDHAWTPISNKSRILPTGFSGTFDGQGHVIKGLNATADKDNFGVGLFGNLNNGTVKNVVIESGKLTAVDHAGAIAGIMFGSSTIENCTNKGVTVNAASASGGIVGRAYGTKNVVKNCNNYGTINGASKNGGIIGIVSKTNSTTEVNGCNNYGEVKGGNAGNGGMIGYIGSPTTVTGCTNTGAIGQTGNRYSGGIVGYSQAKEENAVTISKSSNSGTIVGNDAAGGIFGGGGNSNDFTNITECDNNGEVIGVIRAGGISGTTGFGTISNCSNSAKVTATGAKGVAGGVVGHLFQGTVSDCHGGTAEITGTYPGRQLGSVSNGPSQMAYLALPESGDGYEGDTRSIGIMTPATAISHLTVTKGELIGLPLFGYQGQTITIQEGASWNAFPGETGVWQAQVSSWVKKS